MFSLSKHAEFCEQTWKHTAVVAGRRSKFRKLNFRPRRQSWWSFGPCQNIVKGLINRHRRKNVCPLNKACSLLFGTWRTLTNVQGNSYLMLVLILKKLSLLLLLMDTMAAMKHYSLPESLKQLDIRKNVFVRIIGSCCYCCCCWAKRVSIVLQKHFQSGGERRNQNVLSINWSRNRSHYRLINMQQSFSLILTCIVFTFTKTFGLA